MSTLALMLLGPVSQASRNGQEPFMSWLGIVVAGWVLVTGWRYYLKRRHDTAIPLFNMFWISGICAVILGFSIWDLFR